MPQVVEVTDDMFDTEVMQAKGLVVAEFYTQFCPACKRVTPIFEQLSDDYSGRARFVKADVAKAPEAARKVTVLSAPSIVLFKDGKEVDRVAGYVDKTKLAAIIDCQL
jgi:thioredoxin 1